MSTIGFHIPTRDMTLEELSELIAKTFKELDWAFAGHLDFKNIKADGITAKNIKAGSVTTDKIIAGAITAVLIAGGAVTEEAIAEAAIVASKIAAGAIVADKIAANAVTAEKIQVDVLSAITANLGTILAGIVYGAYIATKQGYPRTEMSVDGDFLAAMKSANNFMRISPSGNYTSPILETTDGTSTSLFGIISGVMSLIAMTDDISINAQFGDLFLSAGNILKLKGAGLTINGQTGWSGAISVITDVDFTNQSTEFGIIVVENGIITNYA